MKPPRRLLAALATLLVLGALAEEAPIRILVGFPPGGGSDLIARLVAERMRTSLGTAVVVENRPGASGAIAAEALKNASPDGRTLMVAPIGVSVFGPLTNSKLRFDPVRDFAPVSLAANFQFVWVVGPATPAKSLPEYVAWVRASPARGTYGVPIAGGPSHFFGVMLGQAIGLQLAAVPYKGGPQLVTDVIGGQVAAAVTSLADVLRQHQAGRLRAVAISGAQRSPLAPDVPTFTELGFAGLEGAGWQAFHTTAGTPRPVIDRLATAVAAAIHAPEVRQALIAEGLDPVGSSADELARRMAEDTARWAPVVKSSGFRADQ